MRPVDVARLIAIGAIWGASFIFVRVAVVPLGPIATAGLRVALASATLLAWLAYAGIPLGWRAHWRLYVAIGTLNSAAPFALWAASAIYIPASYLVVLNATSPLFGAVVSALWLREPITARAALGLAAGIAGVAMLVGLGPVPPTPAVLWAIAAGAVAALLYAVAAAYMKRRSTSANAAAVATGSQIAATVGLAPLLALLPPAAWPTPTEWAAVVALGVLCTGIAYLLYFRLIADTGPTRALTATFLIPVFGMLWGALFLGEAITPVMTAGGALVLAGTALILRRPAQASDPRQPEPLAPRAP